MSVLLNYQMVSDYYYFSLSYETQLLQDLFIVCLTLLRQGIGFLWTVFFFFPQDGGSSLPYIQMDLYSGVALMHGWVIFDALFPQGPIEILRTRGNAGFFASINVDQILQNHCCLNGLSNYK
jgi:hypothetical protein